MRQLNELACVLRAGAEEMGIHLTAGQVGCFQRFFELLVEENKFLNLTAIVGAKDVAIKHFLDSLSCLKAVSFESKMKILDVGAGAGFPGIPLKICRPGLMVTLLESVEKKARFLEKVIWELCLADTKALRERAENIGRKKEYREEFDRVVARAVAKLSVLAEYCLPPVKEKGLFVAMKGSTLSTEIAEASKAITELGGVVREVFHLKLPFTGEERNLVLIEKVRPTPLKYPRRPGIPLKRPL